MNGTLFRGAILLAACAAAVSSAFAQPKGAGADLALKSQMVHTCKDPNNPSVLRQADGGCRDHHRDVERRQRSRWTPDHGDEEGDKGEGDQQAKEGPTQVREWSAR